MINPSRRQRNQVAVPRLRRRSLPRLRIGGKLPQDHEFHDSNATVAKDLHDAPKRVRRRSYSLPRRLVRPKSFDALEESIISDETTLETTSRRRQVSFGDTIAEEKLEFPFDDQAFDATQVWYQVSSVETTTKNDGRFVSLVVQILTFCSLLNYYYYYNQ